MLTGILIADNRSISLNHTHSHTIMMIKGWKKTRSKCLELIFLRLIVFNRCELLSLPFACVIGHEDSQHSLTLFLNSQLLPTCLKYTLSDDILWIQKDQLYIFCVSLFPFLTTVLYIKLRLRFSSA